MKGKTYNPPPNWPQPPEGWTPPEGWEPDPKWGPAPPGHQVWVDDAAKPKDKGQPLFRRRWVQLVGVGLAAFVLGAVAGSGGSGEAQVQAQEASDRADEAEQRADEAEEQVADLEQQVSDAEAAAADARSAVEAEYAGKQAELDGLAAQLAAREAELTGLEQQIEANKIPGDGIFLVGTDIQPGQYRSNEGQCYWARLSGTSGTFDDIIANGNGAAVVSISSGDAAFETRRCGEWTKVG